MTENQNSIRVSVVIPTFNRAALLKELVESLNNQTLAPSSYEVIVVDNCSTDDTAALITGMQSQVRYRLIYHRMPENGGPVRSRNTAAKMARGEVLAFTDSDCRATQQWLERGLAALELHPDAAFVSGPICDKPEQSTGFFTLRYEAPPGEDYTYRAGNIFYRKSVFWEIGGFDETAYYGQTSFMHYECADMDLAWRIKESGRANYYAADMIVYHEVWKVSPWKWLHKQTQLMPLPLFLKRHPHLARYMLWHGPLMAPQNALFYLLIAGLVLAPVRLWFLLMALPYVVWLMARISHSLWKTPLRLAAALVFWSCAQAVMCGSLVWGSIRARRIVL
ncbi:MAG TPA: glycosyltransferase family 2 protein [Bryobacteraceae bacterium]|nr:glycosyltransferase family 2 protein [Bryobacteraceae bacterium]